MSSSVEQYQTVITPIDIAIIVAQDANLSTAASLNGTTGVGIIIPAGLATTSLTFHIGIDGVNYYQLFDLDNIATTLTVDATAKAVWLPAQIFVGWRFLKIRSTAGEITNKTFKLIPYSV